MADSKKETRTKTTPGVVYLSRLPPFMKPAKIRNIFSQYGEVGRLYLQPEGKLCTRTSHSLQTCLDLDCNFKN